MIITAIEPKRKGLSSVYIDGEFAMKLDTEVLISNRIDVGMDIDDETLKSIIERSDIKRAKDKAMWLISYRDHAKGELIEKVRRDTSKEAAIKAVQRLEELGLINDERFATRYASDLINLKHMSKNAAKRKLVEKGIDRELAQQVLDSIDCDTKFHIAAIIDKKYASSLCDEKGKRRCVNALMRLGYNYADIKSVLNQYTDTDDYDY